LHPPGLQRDHRPGRCRRCPPGRPARRPGRSHTLDSANDKAYTGATFKADTTALVERAKSAPGFAALFTQVPHLVLFGGGVVIKLNDEVIAAIGAAGAPGANLDEACARAGIDNIRDRLK
jgi:uncharacterized protein GlcG (DUF336 family)